MGDEVPWLRAEDLDDVLELWFHQLELCDRRHVIHFPLICKLVDDTIYHWDILRII